ncbi:MAG: peptidyl-prolyl cis-trans isomerase [Tissierellia bacterium]|nr:peptidyl-prolyl cis-trans isomerase [Tissierellia bacterium]
MEDKVLLQAQGYKVTEKDVEAFLAKMGQQGLQFNTEEGKKQIAQELMNQNLIYLDALENGLENDPEFKKELEVAKEQILRQFSMKKVLEDVRVSEDEVKAYYQDHKDQFSKVYQYRASHILVDDEDKAKDVEKRLEEEKFEDVAKEVSTCPSSQNGGDLGFFTSGQMVPEFDQALNEMEVGTLSTPVKTQFGYHIIKLVEKEEVKGEDFDSNKADIEAILLGQKQQAAYLQKTAELQEKYKVEKNF